jgi:hypothetical protein
MGCIRQVKNLVYIVPARAGSVYTIDLDSASPLPRFQHALPEIPSSPKIFGRKQIGIASTVDVSENGEHFIVFTHNMRRIFHLTRTSARPLEEGFIGDVNSFSFIGNDAGVCFMKASTEYRLYNLKTRDFVRSFHFAFAPHFSLMGDQCIWSTGSSMSVHRQTARRLQSERS